MCLMDVYIEEQYQTLNYVLSSFGLFFLQLLYIFKDTNMFPFNRYFVFLLV